MSHSSPIIRGIYPTEEAEADFVEVETFADEAECRAWYTPRVRQTNPKYPQCTQVCAS